jgi:putative transposase
VLKAKIAAIFAASRETYGYRSVRAELTRQDVTCGPELVRHLMRALGLRACQPCTWRTTTIRDHDADPIADQVQRDFTADEPGVKLVGDITYIKTWEGFCHLSTVRLPHQSPHRMAIDDHMQTSLINESIAMAARNYDLRPGCIFHSDRGTQYTSQILWNKLAELNLVSPMGRTGVLG